MDNKLKVRWMILFLVVATLGVLGGTMTYIYTQVVAYDKIFAKGVTINEIPIGGLTREEAFDKINSHTGEFTQKRNLILYKDKLSYTIPFEKLGLSYNIEETLDKAYEVGHTGNLISRYHFYQQQGNQKYSFYIVPTTDKNKIQAVVAQYAKKFAVAPVNANLTRKNNTFQVIKEKSGKEMDVPATVSNIIEALQEKEEGDVKVEVVTKTVLPKYTTDSFNEMKHIVASFYTTYNNADRNRNTNLAVAARKISGIIFPNETFSLAKQLEPISYAEGYRSSKVIVNGKLEQGIGGGVCQIASTLYNALLLTQVDISMRQNHSLPVAYVPLGRDATYATGAIDFQFVNTSSHPIYIESYCQNNRAYVNVFAHSSLKSGYTIKFESVTTEVISAPPTQYMPTNNLPKGQQKTEIRALQGKKVKLYKLYYQGDKLIKKELVNNSYYRPRGAVVKVGTQETIPVIKEAPKQNTTPTPNMPPEIPEEPVLAPIEEPIDSSVMDTFEEITTEPEPLPEAVEQ